MRRKWPSVPPDSSPLPSGSQMIVARFCVSETSRGSPMRISVSGLKRVAKPVVSVGSNRNVRAPDALRQPDVLP